jgi:hypothetical protein
MMTSRDTSSENDVLYQFAMNYRHPDAEQLDDYVRRYPGHADALMALAIELVLEQASENAEATVVKADEADAETDAMLSRAMSLFQNRLFEVQKSQNAAVTEHRTQRPAAASRDLFGQRSTAYMKMLCEKLDVSGLFLKRLRDREILAETIPLAFIRLMAQVMEEIEAEVASYFARSPQIAKHVHFMSEVTPAVQGQITFEQAVRTSAMTSEQQTRLLAL